MRGSLVLLAVLVACSDASGPHPGLVLTTKLSSASAGIGQLITVTLNASNTTDTTVRMSFYIPAVAAEVKQGAVWLDNATFVASGIDTVDLTPGATTTVGTINVTFTAGAAISTNDEYFALTPGSYRMRACYAPTGLPSGSPLVCGNGVPFTLTP